MSQFAAGRGKVIALSVALAVALLALLPGAWSASAQTTAGTPADGCPSGFILTAEGCVATTTVTSQTFTGVTGTSGESVTLGDIESGIQVTIPGGYPAGAEFSVETETEVTMTADGESVSVTRVVSITCSGNCTDEPVQVQFNLALLLASFDVEFNISSSLDGICSLPIIGPVICDQIRVIFTSLGLSSTSALLDRPSGASHSIAFGVRQPEGTDSQPLLQSVQRIEAQFVGDSGVIQADLPPGDWGIEFVIATEDSGAPFPADTGTGPADDASGNTGLWVVTALAAVAILGGAGARLAVTRARR